MKEKELSQFLENTTVLTCHKSDWEAIQAFIEAPRLDIDVARKFKLERREREEIDMLKRVRKIIERDFPV